MHRFEDDRPGDRHDIFTVKIVPVAEPNTTATESSIENKALEE